MKTLYILVTVFYILNTQAASEDPNLISVNGVAEQSVDPNMAILQVEVYSKANVAKVAQDLQAKEYIRVKAVIEKFKIKKEDFETQNLSLSPEHVYDEKARTTRIVGYRVSHQIKITYRKIDDVGAVIDALSSTNKADQSGVSVQSIGWDSDKKAAAEVAAMALAVKSARDKADSLAKAAGVSIRSVHLIEHMSNYAESQPMRAYSEMKMIGRGAADQMASTEVSGGPIKVSTQVLMKFNIE